MTPEEQIKKLQEQVEALTKTVTDQTKNFTDAQTQLKESSQFIEDASLLVSAIYKNPELKTNVQSALAGQPVKPEVKQDTPTDDKKNWKFDPNTGKPINEPVKQEPIVDKRVDALDGEKRLEIIDAVERKFKYSGLKQEEKAALRKSVGQRLSSYGMKVAEIPVDQLEEKLSDAYLLVGLEGAKAQGKTDDVVNSFFEEPGKFPSMAGGNPDNSQTQLTPANKKWAAKLNVPEDKVAANLKELTETGAITYKPKEEVKTTKTPAPSGTPIPPTATS